MVKLKLKINHNSSLSYHVYRKSNTFIKLKLKFKLKLRLMLKLKFSLLPCHQPLNCIYKVRCKLAIDFLKETSKFWIKNTLLPRNTVDIFLPSDTVKIQLFKSFPWIHISIHHHDNMCLQMLICITEQ